VILDFIGISLTAWEGQPARHRHAPLATGRQSVVAV